MAACHLTGILTRLVIAGQIERFILPYGIIQRVECSGISQKRKILREDEEQVRSRPLHELFREPLTIVVLSDTADVPDLHPGMFLLIYADCFVKDLIHVPDRRTPVTARVDAYRKLDRF